MYRYLLCCIACLLLNFNPLFAVTDTTVGVNAAGSSDYKTLSHNICDGLGNETEKANAIYNWITHHIKYDTKEMYNLTNPQGEEAAKNALKQKTATCAGYAMLFTMMCREAGMKAATVDGYAKDWTFDNGDEIYIPRHEWCAVKADGRWILADPTWGAGVLVQTPPWWRKMLNKIKRRKVSYSDKLTFQFRYKAEYFNQDPREFRFKHLAADPQWQLTDTAMPLAVFEAGDSAIRAFNKISTPIKRTSELDKIAEMTEEQKVFEYSERVYAANNRFPAALTLKNTIRAGAEIEKALSDTAIETGVLLLNDARNGLKKSQVYLADQKKLFPDQYMKLSKKNRAKNQDAKDYIREIKGDDKRLAGQCKKYSKMAAGTYGRMKKKAGDMNRNKRGLNPNKITGIEPSKVQKKKGSA